MSPDATVHFTPSGQPRARAIGIPFDGTPGELNAITDVPGVEVGFTTLIEGEDVRTGVTAILPRGRSDPGDPCAAGFYSLNGNGEMTGVSWIEESGTVSLPITLTNTHSVGTAHEATIRWMVDHFPEVARAWLLPVAAETWDGYLNDTNGRHVSVAHVMDAISSARPGAVEEGSVGGGTGMNCYGFKGGTGTASRVVAIESNTYRVGVLLQCNFGSRHELTIAGVPMGAALAADNPLEDDEWFTAGSGSVIGIVVTDAPMLPGQCKALARRVPLGLARTGTTGSHFSGDLFLALSTANRGAFGTGLPIGDPADAVVRSLEFVDWKWMDEIYAGVVQATEEAVVNALVVNREMVGRDGHRTPALPHGQVTGLLEARLG